MALAPIAPWLSINPMDFVNASAQGARLGLERSQIQTGAQEAADRLGLGYAQLNSENARSGAALSAEMARANAADALKRTDMTNALAQWAQEMGLKKQQADTMEKYRQDEIAARERQIGLLDQFHKGELVSRKNQLALQLHKMLTTKKPGEGSLTFNGTQVPYLFDPTTGHPVFAPVGNMRPGALTDQEKLAFTSLKEEHAALSKKWADPLISSKAKTDGRLKDDFEKDQTRLKEIEAQMKGLLAPKTAAPATPAADALSNPNQEPISISDEERGPGTSTASTNASPLKILSIRPAGTFAPGDPNYDASLYKGPDLSDALAERFQ